MLFPALCSGATTHILICLCFPCILLPVPSWACWRPPCCRPRTDHPTRYNPAPFSLSASCTWAPAPAAPLFTLSLSQLQIPRERMWNDHGNQTSQKFPLLFCTLYFPISYWSNLFFLLSFPFQTMKEPFQFMGFFFSFLSGEEYIDLSVFKNGKPRRCTLYLVTTWLLLWISHPSFLVRYADGSSSDWTGLKLQSVSHVDVTS